MTFYCCNVTVFVWFFFGYQSIYETFTSYILNFRYVFFRLNLEPSHSDCTANCGSVSRHGYHDVYKRASPIILYKLAQLVSFVLALILGKLKCIIRVHEGHMLTKRFYTVSAHELVP